jgi:hypothetical protein
MASRLAGVAAAAATLAACVTANAPTPLDQGQGAVIAFESIDGAPQPAYDRLLRGIATEAGARRIVVVPREREADYRIRAYLALEAASGSLAWAWDVYDARRNRAFRMTGSEPAPGGSWATLGDGSLQRIARAAIAELAAFAAADQARSQVAVQAPAPAGALPAGPTGAGQPPAVALAVPIR